MLSRESFSGLSILQGKGVKGSCPPNTKWLPAEGAAFTSLRHGDESVGDRCADVGAHDDRNSQLDRQHCQSTQISFITSPPSPPHLEHHHHSCIRILSMHVYPCAWSVEARTHVQRRPCWQLWRRKWTSSGPAGWPERQWPGQPEGWTTLRCPERCHLLLYLDKVNIGACTLSRKCCFSPSKQYAVESDWIEYKSRCTTVLLCV